MATPTTNKGYSKQALNENPGTWGTPLNDNFDIIDKNLAGVQTKSLSSSNVTLTSTEAQNLFLVLSGTLTANVTVTWPAVGGLYIVDNQTTGSYTVTLASAGAGASVASTGGTRTLIWSDGTNIRSINAFDTTTLRGATTLTGRATFSAAAAAITAKGTVSSGTATFDVSENYVQSVTVGGAHTWAFSNWAAGYSEILIIATNPGSATLTYPTINWAVGDGTYTTNFNLLGISLQTSGKNHYLIWSSDGGATLYGRVY